MKVYLVMAFDYQEKHIFSSKKKAINFLVGNYHPDKNFHFWYDDVEQQDGEYDFLLEEMEVR